MARVTVEDCITVVNNRFDLVLMAAQRSRQISSGAPLNIERDNDKNPVVALREIAEEKVAPSDLMTSVVNSHRQYQAKPDSNEEELDSILIEDKKSKLKNIEIGGSESATTQP